MIFFHYLIDVRLLLPRENHKNIYIKTEIYIKTLNVDVLTQIFLLFGHDLFTISVEIRLLLTRESGEDIYIETEIYIKTQNVDANLNEKVKLIQLSEKVILFRLRKHIYIYKLQIKHFPWKLSREPKVHPQLEWQSFDSTGI